MFSKAGKLHDDMKKGQEDHTLVIEHSLFAAANAESEVVSGCGTAVLGLVWEKRGGEWEERGRV